CHYALFVDDFAMQVEPAVVWVSPADPHPETIDLVAGDVREFIELVRSLGIWPEPLDARAQAAKQRAVAQRQQQMTYPTLDGLGVLCRPEPSFMRPSIEWLQEEPGRFRDLVDRLLQHQAPGLALAMARDLIAVAAQAEGFRETCAKIYEALE